MKMNRIKFILVMIIILVIWEVITYLGIAPPLFFASPISIIKSSINMFSSSSIYSDIFATLFRTLLAFIFSIIMGTPLGILIGYYSKEKFGIETLVDFLRSIPPIALFPLFIFFFGIGNISKIAVSTFSGTMIIIISGIYGAKQINQIRLKLARKIGLKGRRLFLKVLFPESLDNIFSGYRVAISFCFILVIVTEMFLGGANSGLGKTLIDAQMLYDIPKLYALIFICGLIGYSINKSFFIIENKIIHWRGK